MRRTLLSLLILILMASSASALTTAETKLLKHTNRSRIERGLERLEPGWRITRVARHQARRMRDRSSLFHLVDLPSGCLPYGENVGVGPSPWKLHRAFMRSPDHRRNILDPRFTKVGVGMARDDEGALWVSVIFCR